MPQLSWKFVNSSHVTTGMTYVSFHHETRSVVTGGADTAVKVYAMDHWAQGEPLISWEEHQEPITALTCSTVDGSVVTGAEDCFVWLFDLTTKQHVKLLCRLTKAVKCVALNKEARRVAIASEESNIRVVSLDDIKNSMALIGHDGPVMAVTWSADSSRLASAGTDGSLRIWNATDGGILKVKHATFAKEMVKKDEKFSLQYITFHGTEYLVFPTAEGIQWMTGDFQVLHVIKIPEMQLPRIFAISDDQQSLCVADQVQCIGVIALNAHLSDSNMTDTWKHNKTVTDVAWGPGNTLAIADNAGSVGLWHDAVPQQTPSQVEDPSEDIPETLPPPQKKSVSKAVALMDVVKETQMSQVTDSQVSTQRSAKSKKVKAKKAEQSPRPKKTKAKGIKGQQHAEEEDEGDEDEEGESCPFLAKVEEDDEEEDGEETDSEMEEDLDEEEVAMVRKVQQAGYAAYEGGDSVVDDDAEATPAKPQAAAEAEGDTELADEYDEMSEVAVDQVLGTRVLLQEAFQTTSIPDLEATGISILVCNAYGVVKLHNMDDGPPAVTITPADQAKYKPARIAGHNAHLAALGKTGTVLACKTNENSYIMFKALDTWASNSGWNLYFAPGEDIIGLGINSKYIAVFTTRFMRVFTASGLETAVISFPHRFVTCAGCEKYLMAVVFDDGGTELKCSVYDLHSRTAIHQMVPVALSTGSHLMWLGWSDDAVLSTCDTIGVVRCLHSDFGIQWIPMYDPLTRNEKVKLWPTGLDRTKLYGIPCKNGSNYPPASADLSVPQSVELMIPLTATDKVEYRERYLRTLYKAEEMKRNATVYTAEIQEIDREMDRYSYAMFEAALEKDQTQRAFDCAACFNFRSTYEQAMKKAHSKGHAALLKGMTEILNRRFSKCRRLCQLPDPGQKERKKEQLEKKLQEKIQKIVPIPVITSTPTTQRQEETDETQMDESAPDTEQTQQHSPPPHDVSKQLFGTSQSKGLSSEKDTSKKTKAAAPLKPTESPFACFSPNSKLQSTPNSIDAAVSTLANMSQTRTPLSIKGLTTSPIPSAMKSAATSTPTQSTVAATPPNRVHFASSLPPTQATPSTPLPSAEAKLVAARFVRNPSHTYQTASKNASPMTTPKTASAMAVSPAPTTSTAATPSVQLSRVDEPIKREKVSTPGVSSELSRTAISALKKRQMDEDDGAEDNIDIPALKIPKVTS